MLCMFLEANCNFENGLCTWTSSTDSGYWKTTQASNNPIKGSPQKDHTINSGNGLYSNRFFFIKNMFELLQLSYHYLNSA